jgi:hypothetical protein
MALNNLKNKNFKKQDPGYGLILEVVTATSTDGNDVVVYGKVMNSTVLAKPGEMVTVNGDHTALQNMRNGGANFKELDGSAGTVLVLEGCRQTRVENDMRLLSTRYVTTLKTNSLSYDEGIGRDFVSALASAPVLRFPNVQAEPGEPKMINYAMNSDGIFNRAPVEGKWETKHFDRDWVEAKLLEAQKASKKPNMYIDTLKPEQATLIYSFEELRETAKAVCNNSDNTLFVLRAFDGEDVTTRKVTVIATKGEDGKYFADLDKTLNLLEEKGMFHQVADNSKLFDEVTAGTIALELIPGERLYFGSDTKKNMINRSLINPPKDKEGNAMNTMAFTFGDKPYNMAKVLLPCMVMEDTGAKLVINLIREEPGRVELRDVVTPNTPNGTQQKTGFTSDTPGTQQKEGLTMGDMMSEDEDTPALGDETFDINSSFEEEPASTPGPGM